MAFNAPGIATWPPKFVNAQVAPLGTAVPDAFPANDAELVSVMTGPFIELDWLGSAWAPAP